ncbi:Detected protein of unknown function [Hibiscus syriacus]|uniref:Uncharacterized protein n=1 Tax=Hibiscus syriacus TaxID=106335 RepID=A0A6A3CFJ1_HIBSY|nr:Detected protein of unknown function [Hibiscus syriacus]
MPRSSRHKSSKHSYRDDRDYSDSEKESSLKEEKKSKEENSGRFSKDPGSVEKIKVDYKDTSKYLWISENGDYADDCSSSKRHKDKADDVVSDRWNGDEDNGKGEKRSRTSGESKSKRREGAEGDDTKRSKSEGKHRESSTKEEREREKDKEGRSDRLIESEERRPLKHSAERTGNEGIAMMMAFRISIMLHVPDRLQSPKSESPHERRLRKKRDVSDDGDKHLEDNGGILERQLSISSDTGKDARAKDKSYKDKYREEMNCEDKCQDDKLRGDQLASDLANSKSSEKHLRDRKDDEKVQQKKSKVQDNSKGRKQSTSGRVEVDSDRGRSQSRPANFDAATGSNRRRASPSTISHGGTDEYRHLKQEDSNYRDQMAEQKSKAASSREVTSLTPERGAKYRSMEKSNRVNEGHSGELPIERFSSSKASPMSMKERSPSTSLERRYVSRSGVKRGLDIEELGWSSASVGGREEDNKLSRDLPLEKPLLDGSFQADSVFYNKAGQGNSSLISQPPGLKAGIGSPSFMGSLEEDNRFNNSGRYKSGDLNVRRGHANAWRGAPNWSAPVPNGFIPFQPHGAFQAMLPQFPSPSLFGVRPSMEINHSGIPYHIPDAERFNSHLRPMGWQNTMDGSGPAPFHGWDGHNVSFRDEVHLFGHPEWDQSRHPVNGRGWDTGSDVWKGQNGDSVLPATFQKEDHHLQVNLDDVYDGPERQKFQYENGNNGAQAKGLEIRFDVLSPVKESSRFSSEIPHKAPDSSKISSEDDDARCCQAYLCKLDISAELAGSDLYDQCRILMNVERNRDLSNDVTMLVNLKNGGRPVQNTSIALLSPSLIPPANASVFQRAMDHYKKHQLQMGAVPNVNGGTIAFTSATKEKGKEQSFDHVVDLAEEPGPISDAEMVDSEMLDSDQRKGEAVPTATRHKNMEQLVSTQSRELLDHPDSLSPEKSEQLNTDFGHMNTEVPKPVLNGNEAEESETDQMNSGDVVRDPLRSLDNAADAVHLAADEENSNDINETKGNSSVYCAKEIHTSGDSVSGSLNDSSKVSGSNESESVILSQIHHSHESTN